jgi:hypothetical protein
MVIGEKLKALKVQKNLPQGDMQARESRREIQPCAF